MALRKRTIIRVETNSLSVIHPVGKSIDVWCAACAAVVPMVTPERAAQLCHASPRVVYRLVESEEVHFVEVSAGELFICFASLQPKQT